MIILLAALLSLGVLRQYSRWSGRVRSVRHSLLCLRLVLDSTDKLLYSLKTQFFI